MIFSPCQKMREGGIKIALIYGDQVHTIPVYRFHDALSKVPFIVSFSSLWTIRPCSPFDPS
jgi:hypothetical protein